MLYFDTINIVISVAGLINLVIGLIIYIHQPKSAINRSFFLLMSVISLWAFLMFFFRSLAGSHEYALVIARIMYAIAALVPAIFLSFVVGFLGYKHKYKRIIGFVGASLVSLIVVAIITTPILLTDVILISRNLEPIITFNNTIYVIYALYIMVMFMTSYVFLVHALLERRRRNKSIKQIFYIILSTSVAATATLVTNLIAPLFGYFELNWFGQISILLMVLFLAYGVYKERIFNARIATVELLVATSLILSLSQIILSKSSLATMFSFVTLILFGVFGLALIKTVNREIKANERLQKQKKKLRQLNKRLVEMDEKKTEFLHIATHQLRGPITAIRGYTALLHDGDYGKMNNQIQVPLQKILVASEVMTDTINDYMDIARIEENRIKIKPEDLNLCEIVIQQMDMAKVHAEKQGIQFILDIDKESNSQCAVHADMKSIVQVLNALLENAIKYTPQGTVTLQAGHSADGKRAVIKVKDSGIGIPKAEIDNIFSKFSRASNAKQSSIFGTGMGLFIAKSLIEVNGGSINVASDGNGKGTTFTMELPLVDKR